jgi:hypothetical protein
MSWTRLYIRGATQALDLAELHERFWQWYVGNAMDRCEETGAFPDDVAMFVRQDPRGAETAVYFTPGAAAFVARFGDARVCDIPIGDKHFRLTIGDARAWALVRGAGPVGVAERAASG